MNLRKIEGRVAFYIDGSTPKAEQFAHEFHGPDDYLAEAIRLQLSDETVAFLQTEMGQVFVIAMELHHQDHGAVSWAECPDVRCRRDGREWAMVVRTRRAA